MSTKKAISTSFVAIFILIITQIIAQSIASMFVIIKIPTGIYWNCGSSYSDVQNKIWNLCQSCW